MLSVCFHSRSDLSSLNHRDAELCVWLENSTINPSLRDDAAHFRQPSHQIRRCCIQLLCRRQHIRLSRSTTQCALHRCLFKVSRGQPCFGMHPGNSHEENVSSDLANGLKAGCAHCYNGVLKETPAKQNDLYGLVWNQLEGDRRTMRDHCGAEIRRQVARDFS